MSEMFQNSPDGNNSRRDKREKKDFFDVLGRKIRYGGKIKEKFFGAFGFYPITEVEIIK